MRKTSAVPLAGKRKRSEVPQLELTALAPCACRRRDIRIGLVRTTARALVGATRCLWYCGTRHNVRSATIYSMVVCEAACGVGGTHKIAQLECHTPRNLS